MGGAVIRKAAVSTSKARIPLPWPFLSHPTRDGRNGDLLCLDCSETKSDRLEDTAASTELFDVKHCCCKYSKARVGFRVNSQCQRALRIKMPRRCALKCQVFDGRQGREPASPGQVADRGF